MKTAIIILHTIVAILFMISVLVQNKGAGLSAAIGGQAGQMMATTKRGAEKVVYNASIVLAIAFVLLSIAFIFVP